MVRSCVSRMNKAGKLLQELEKEIHAMSSSITARIDEMGARIESLDTHVDQLMDRSKAASEAAEPSGEGG
eukprot:jgi/Pico_ML_1/54073/g4498.t2